MSIAELLHLITSCHKGVGSTVSTSACQPEQMTKHWHKCWQWSLQPHQSTCYITEEDTARFRITHIWAVYGADVFSGQRHHALACGSFWVWWRLHWVWLLLKGASQPLIGLSLFILPRDESDPNRLWSGGEMGLPTRDVGGWWAYALGCLTKNKRSRSLNQTCWSG